MKFIARFVLFCGLMWAALAGVAQSWTDVHALNEPIQMGKRLDILSDDAKWLSFEEVSSVAWRDSFYRSESEIPFFNYSFGRYWVRFGLFNASDKAQKVFLWLDYPLLYKIRLFVPNAQAGVDTLFAGDGYRFDKRVVKSSTNLFELELAPGDSVLYFASVESDGDLISLPMRLETPMNTMQVISMRSFQVGLFNGLMLLIVIMNLFYWLNLRDKVYLIYTGYVLSVSLFIAERDGLTFKYLWPDWPTWNNLGVSVFSSLTMIFILQVMHHTLETKEHFPRLHRAIRWYAYAIMVLMVPLVFPPYYRVFINFGNLLAVGTIVLALILIVRAMRRKIYYVRYFALALLFLVVGTFMLVMKNNGVPGFFQHESLFKIFVSLEILTLTYGLTVRFNMILQASKQQAIERLEELNQTKEEANRNLEQKVSLRTVEIEEKKEELQQAFNALNEQNNRIMLQTEALQRVNNQLTIRNQEVEQHRDEIEAQKDEIERQRDIVLAQKNNLTQSIEYAEKIQQAVLPSQEILSDYFSDFMVYFKPRDIVSGDFYWWTQSGDYLIIAVGDCTGHGVPGAFMSMLGVMLLDEIVIKEGVVNPAKILNRMRSEIILMLKQEQNRHAQRDGMDMALISIDTREHKLFFAGANNPLYLIRHDELLEIQAQRMPISVYRRMDSFTETEIQLLPNDCLYMFSDGYADQLGEYEDSKFSLKRFRQILQLNHHKARSQQAALLELTHENWRGDFRQIDDMVVIGLRV